MNYFILIFRDGSTSYFAGTFEGLKELIKLRHDLLTGYFAFTNEEEALKNYSLYTKIYNPKN